jgi:hypothetical protein
MYGMTNPLLTLPFISVVASVLLVGAAPPTIPLLDSAAAIEAVRATNDVVVLAFVPSASSSGSDHEESRPAREFRAAASRFSHRCRPSGSDGERQEDAAQPCTSANEPHPLHVASAFVTERRLLGEACAASSPVDDVAPVAVVVKRGEPRGHCYEGAFEKELLVSWVRSRASPLVAQYRKE